MAARSTEHQDNQQSENEPSELSSHHNENQSPENEDGAADEEINNKLPKDYQPLYLAALQGNWKFAYSKFFENDPNAFTEKISIFSMTALHAAACNGQTEFVEKMLLDERLPYLEVLKMRGADGLTPLHYAAMAGNLRMAEALVTKDPSLPQIVDYNDFTPLLTACAVAPECKELLWYLVRETKDDPPASPFTGKMAGLLISCLAYAGFYDILQYLLERYPDLITTVSLGNTSILKAMAEAPSHFKSGHPFGIWEKIIYRIVPVEPIATVSRSLKGDMEEPSQNSTSYADTPVWRRTYVPQGSHLSIELSDRIDHNSLEFGSGLCAHCMGLLKSYNSRVGVHLLALVAYKVTLIYFPIVELG